MNSSVAAEHAAGHAGLPPQRSAAPTETCMGTSHEAKTPLPPQDAARGPKNYSPKSPPAAGFSGGAIVFYPGCASGFCRVFVTPVEWAGGWEVSMEMSFSPRFRACRVTKLWSRTLLSDFCFLQRASKGHGVKLLMETPPSYLQAA